MVGGFPVCCARAASGHARRAAEQGDELAPFQLIELHTLPLARVSMAA